MRYRPAVYLRSGRYRSRLNVSGLWGATSFADIVAEFATAEEALADLMFRLRLVYQLGDRVELRGMVYRDMGEVEAELRALLARSASPAH
jgi:hypothetical protein